MAQPDGHRARFESIYREFSPQVFTYCLRRTREPDEVFAETFLVVWRRIDDVPPSPGTLPYLYGIAGRVLSTHLRGLRRRTRLDAKLASLGVEPPLDPGAAALSPRLQEVAAAVERLPFKDREIVKLYAWEELPRETIAQIMGMTRNAVDQRIHRAYKRLARVLEPALRTSPQSSPIAEKGGT
jgi:RNA polymerase sigma-70 factor (ECF subfamily)